MNKKLILIVAILIAISAIIILTNNKDVADVKMPDVTANVSLYSPPTKGIDAQGEEIRTKILESLEKQS